MEYYVKLILNAAVKNGAPASNATVNDGFWRTAAMGSERPQLKSCGTIFSRVESMILRSHLIRWRQPQGKYRASVVIMDGASKSEGRQSDVARSGGLHPVII
ncbi:MAG TPA: hypothetical protein VF600_00515 [Abditibacteriaceae bacterium]